MKFEISLIEGHPSWPAVISICEKIHSAGYTAWLAGGCVRDAYLGRVPNDLDVATSAEPGVIESLFVKTVGVGKAFGVMRVIEQGQDIEVATFRRDGPYLDGRRPEFIEFAKAEEDAKRRDFAMNALFYDPLSKVVHDYVNGLSDIHDRVIRAVGDPEARFREDHLRMLRAVRFRAQLGFALEAKTCSAVLDLADLIRSVASERVVDELEKLGGGSYLHESLPDLPQSGLLQSLWPKGNWKILLSEAPDFGGLMSKQGPILIFFSRAWRVEVDLKSWLESLKLSSEVRKQVYATWKLLHDLEVSPSLDQADLMQWRGSSDGEFVLELLCRKNLLQVEVRSRVEALWQRWGKRLPEPWIRAMDLKDLSLDGPALGRVLKWCYRSQLREDFKDSRELLASLSPSLIKDINSETNPINEGN